jgi:serralysin
VSGLTFTETTGTADLTVTQRPGFGFGGGGAETVVSGGIIQSSHVTMTADAELTIGTRVFTTFLHEIGHALGLGHGGNYNASTVTYGVNNHYANDTPQFTIMSYFRQEDFRGASSLHISTPAMADIYAVVQLYGGGSARATDTVYGFNSSGHDPATAAIYDFSNYGIVYPTYTTAPAFTIYDTGGIDTLDGSGYDADQNISLVPGTWSDIGGWNGNIGIYLTSVIENAIGGAGDDTITGNSADNRLVGNLGDDVLIGGAGRDALIGGPGVDTASYMNASAGVRAELHNPRKNSGEAAGDTYDSIENLTGSPFADMLKGDHGANVISGGGGNDTLVGMSGEDTFYFATASDGIDTIDDFDGDFIALSQDAFDLSSLHSGENFIAGKKPAAFADTSTILYDTNAGTLAWDADGIGELSPVQFAILSNRPVLMESDFILV